MQVGRRRTPKEVRELIFQMVAENPTWGAPRIHGELLMLGFELSERTISRWMKRAPRDLDPAKHWLAFLRNHREAIAAMDFFSVPTITFGMLYCFFVISHDRRRIVHFNVTNHPTSLWIVQQLREAFPFESAPRFLIFDRDAKYGLEVPAAVRSLKISPVRTSFESPWQNGVAERWVESSRRDLLDHIIAVNKRHLKRLLYWEACSTVTIELHSPDQLFARPQYMYTRRTRAGPCSPQSLCSVEAMLIAFTPSRRRIAPSFVADEVLARDKGLKSRRTIFSRRKKD